MILVFPCATPVYRVTVAQKLTETQVKKRLADFFNYKRLYGETHERYLQEKERRKKAQEEIARLKGENTDLRQQLKEMAEAKQAKKAWFRQNYSVAGQEKKSGKQERHVSPGRTPKEKKLSAVNEERHMYPEDIDPERCIISHNRYVTHIRNGQKHVVLYHLYKAPWGEPPRLPGVMPRGEYGIEVAITLAFLVYLVEVSIDQARWTLRFFAKIDLSRSQADSLLNQLSTLWTPEFEKLITLISLALVVHIDETGWKIGKERNYAWIFEAIAHVVFLYGQKRSEETLEQVLSRAFPGTVVSDFFSTYENYFTAQQKCWAHILRDAIKLMLQQPTHKEYKRLFEKLHMIFLEGKEAREDSTLTEAQRERKVNVLQRTLRKTCDRASEKIPADASDDLRDFLNLQKRLLKYEDSLFTFVLRPAVDPTNNRAERGLRKTAKARNNYQTSKTADGAKRRSVIASVLTSLERNLAAFSLEAVIEETSRWRAEGISLFERQLQAAQVRASPA